MPEAAEPADLYDLEKYVAERYVTQANRPNFNGRQTLAEISQPHSPGQQEHRSSGTRPGQDI